MRTCDWGLDGTLTRGDFGGCVAVLECLLMRAGDGLDCYYCTCRLRFLCLKGFFFHFSCATLLLMIDDRDKKLGGV